MCHRHLFNVCSLVNIWIIHHDQEKLTKQDVKLPVVLLQVTLCDPEEVFNHLDRTRLVSAATVSEVVQMFTDVLVCFLPVN